MDLGEIERELDVPAPVDVPLEPEREAPTRREAPVEEPEKVGV